MFDTAYLLKGKRYPDESFEDYKRRREKAKRFLKRFSIGNMVFLSVKYHLKPKETPQMPDEYFAETRTYKRSQ